jgi:renalase
VTVVVVGAGIAGIACASALVESGQPVRVLDRGRRMGGRMAVMTRDGRPIDVGASYLTVRDAELQRVVEGWERLGLAWPWTDTFHVASPGEGITGTTTGPFRWAARRGLRSLVEAYAAGLRVVPAMDVAEVSAGPEVDGDPVDAVVLAMPDPQARDLLGDELEASSVLGEVEWEPVIAVAAGWPARRWPELDGVFVNGSAIVSWIADDGRRRGDAAPVLVAHSTPGHAEAFLDDPLAAARPMVTEVRALLGIDADPSWVEVKRWSLARPVGSRAALFHLGDDGIGLCGDGWAGPPRIEAAFRSGRALGLALAERLPAP